MNVDKIELKKQYRVKSDCVYQGTQKSLNGLIATVISIPSRHVVLCGVVLNTKHVQLEFSPDELTPM